MGIGMGRRVALALAAGVLGTGILAGAAVAAFVPEAPSGEALVEPAGGPALAEKGKLGDRLKDALDKLVAEGKITAAQRDQILSALTTALEKVEKVEKKRPFDLRRAVGDANEAAAKYIGIDEKALRPELASGKSLAEIATSKGKTRDGLIAAIVAGANAKIDAATDLTPEQKAALRTEAAAYAAKLADAKRTPKVAPERKPEPKPDPSKERKRPDVSSVSVHAFIGGYLKPALAYIGLDEKAVGEQLRSGKSLAEVAVASGKTRDGLIAAIASGATPKIDANEKLSAEQKAKLKGDVRAAVEKIVDAKGRAKGPAPKVDKPKSEKKQG